MASAHLPKRQRAVWQYIAKWSYDKGYPPTYREIAEGLKMASVSTVVYHLDALQRKGYIRRTDNAARSIEVLIAPPPPPTLRLIESERKEERPAVRVPIIGEIAASPPIQANPESGSLDLPAAMLQHHPDAYILKVRGNSMTGAGIGDGDFVLVQPSDTASNGEIVVACLDDNTVTLKHFYHEGATVRLAPANPAYTPIFVPSAEVRVQARLLYVIRRFAEN